MSSSQPATPEQRKAITFKGKKVKFNWPNEEWVAEFLLPVRLAVAALEKNDRALEGVIREFREGDIPDLLDGLTHTKRHLQALAKMIDTVLHRHFIVLERLGYEPDNPPPDAKLN
jgi:hypothetical protein